MSSPFSRPSSSACWPLTLDGSQSHLDDKVWQVERVPVWVFLALFSCAEDMGSNESPSAVRTVRLLPS